MIVGWRNSKAREVERAVERKGGGQEKLRLFRKKRAGEGNLCKLNQW